MTVLKTLTKMPTVILVDNSSSTHSANNEGYTKLELALHGVHAMLDYLSVHSKLEFVGLMTFAVQPDVVCPFTRDLAHVKHKLSQIKGTNELAYLDQAFNGVEKFITAEWGSGLSCHIILITPQESILNSNKFSFSFPVNFVLAVIKESNCGPFVYQNEFHKKYMVERQLTRNHTVEMFKYLTETNFSPWVGHMFCGNFASKVTMSPSPMPYHKITDFNSITYKMDTNLEICGFIELQHLGSPAAISRHLVFPYSLELSLNPNHLPDSDEDGFDEGQSASFCVLLHGALKVENMAALCQVGNDWYGVLFSWADSKKKSNLMLSLLEPGPNSVPWLGDLNNLTIPSSSNTGETFPVRPVEKRSYSQNCIAWIRQPGLQSDIQKILRHARKIPDKTQQFYKELNRVRRAAICLGFLSLIDGIADILERECTLLPGSAHPACAFQLSHAAGILREPYSKDPKYNIMPMKMSFG